MESDVTDGDEAVAPVDSGRVEWRATPERDFAEPAKHGLAGLYLAFLSLVAVGMVFFALGTSGGGDGWVFLVLLFVGGPASLLYIATAVGVDGTASLVKLVPGAETLSLPGVTLAMLVGGVALLAAVVHPLMPVAYAAALVGLYVLDNARRTAGEVDVASTTLAVYAGETERRRDISSFAGLRSFRVGDYVVCWLRYDGPALVAPRAVVFPAGAFPAVRAALDEIRTAERDDTISGTAVRVVAAAFGLFFLGATAFVVVVVGNPRLSAYAISVLGLFGVLFLYLAWKS
ncbi:hypothetical protein [Haloprofundus halobius]|uniref:hypothetical protein n=1 Tax=Haloprofundus halobius TaxID=2876194 RepID=UPI001CCF6BF9|nr:hypothetical protein [Haloprofundus halobius]